MPPPSGTTKLARRLGARLRYLRAEAGLTLEKLAWECDLSKPYLSQIESGKRLPSLTVLHALAERLDVELAELVAFDLDEPRLALLEATRRHEWKTAGGILRRLKADAGKS